jgi:hypothetical protein
MHRRFLTERLGFPLHFLNKFRTVRAQVGDGHALAVGLQVAPALRKLPYVG